MMGSELTRWGKDILFLLTRIGADAISLAYLLTVALPFRTILKLTSTRYAKNRFNSILITGASTGIGAQLAKAYARPGCTLALLSYKDNENLKQVAEECRRKGAHVEEIDQDVADHDGMREVILRFDDDHPLDLVVANAGISTSKDGLQESRRVLDVNVMGVVNTVLPALERMRPRRQGQLALTSSLGGYASPACKFMLPYLASKHAIRVYGEGLRAVLKQEGIGVTVLYPGFTRSEMTQKLAKRGVKFPSLYSEENAVKLIKAGIDHNHADVYYPLGLYIASRILGNLPTWATQLMMPLLMNGDPFRPLDFAED